MMYQTDIDRNCKGDCNHCQYTDVCEARQISMIAHDAVNAMNNKEKKMHESTEQKIEKLEFIIGSYLMSGNADNDLCKEWRELLEETIKALKAREVLTAQILKVVKEEEKEDPKWAKGLKYSIKIINKYFEPEEDDNGYKFPEVIGQKAEMLFEGEWVSGVIVEGYRFRDGIVTIETPDGRQVWCGQDRTDLYRKAE